MQIDGECVMDEFEKSIAKNGAYKSEYKKLLSSIEYFSTGETLPGTKFKLLKRAKNDTIKDFEFKTNHLRVYGYVDSNGYIVILCGYKNTQPQDINKMRILKKTLNIEKK